MSGSISKWGDNRQRVGFSMDAGLAFRIICYSGLAGILVDIDHIIFWIVQYFTKGELAFTGRVLHTPLLIGSGIVLLGCGAYLGGLYIKYLLRR